MKKFLLSMVAVLVSVAASAWTVSFTNPQGWSEVAVWAWNETENFTGGVWPGQLMTKSGDVWTYTGEGEPTKVIFNNNNNGSQTTDLKFEDGATYDMDGVVGAVIEYGDIYVPVSEYNYPTCYIYSWTPSIFGNPGTEMTKTTINGTEYWVAKVNKDLLPATVGGWLLHDGAWGNKANDGNDLPSVEFQSDYIYNIDGTSVPLSSVTGIADIIGESSDAAPVYYNLQGVRVAEPTNGLYIVVRGNKVAKELVK